jgi:hypothetical protein
VKAGATRTRACTAHPSRRQHPYTGLCGYSSKLQDSTGNVKACTLEEDKGA